MNYSQYSIAELIEGFVFNSDSNSYNCIFCGDSTKIGYIYQIDNQLMDAKRYIEEHLEQEHKTVFHELIGLNKRLTGLTDSQKNILQLLFEGKSDQEIASDQGLGSSSTVRQHRFKLREKVKQAKLFLAIMELVDKRGEDKQFASIHKEATMVDERWVITVEEEKKVLESFVDDLTGRIKQFPRKEKRKIVILKYILNSFSEGESYTEKEVNEKIKEFYDDFATVRRYLIEYGFLFRNKDGSTYWKN